MTIEPKRLIPDYIPNPKAPAMAPPPAPTQHIGRVAHEARATMWATWGLAEPIAYRDMLLAKPGLDHVKLQLVRCIADRRAHMGVAR